MISCAYESFLFVLHVLHIVGKRNRYSAKALTFLISTVSVLLLYLSPPDTLFKLTQ